jgi:transposase
LDERLQDLSAQLEAHPSPQRRIKRWVHEDVLERARARLDKNPNAMRTRRETVAHPFGTLKMRLGATHFLCVTLPKVATEMALCVLGYNLTRVLNIVGCNRGRRR